MKQLNYPSIFLILVFSLTICFTPILHAQKLSDSALSQMSRIELGNYYMKKSKKEKLMGYLFFGTGIATFVATAVAGRNESDATLPLFLTSMVTLAIGNPTLSSGAKSKGKAEMLLRQPVPGESAEDVNALAKKYKTSATISSVTGWTLLLGGVAGLYVSGNSGSGSGAILSLSSMFLSVPIWMNAAKNRGRASILLNQENTPVGLRTDSKMRSIGISIPISR